MGHLAYVLFTLVDRFSRKPSNDGFIITGLLQMRKRRHRKSNQVALLFLGFTWFSQSKSCIPENPSIPGKGGLLVPPGTGSHNLPKVPEQGSGSELRHCDSSQPPPPL